MSKKSPCCRTMHITNRHGRRQSKSTTHTHQCYSIIGNGDAQTFIDPTVPNQPGEFKRLMWHNFFFILPGTIEGETAIFWKYIDVHVSAHSFSAAMAIKNVTRPAIRPHPEYCIYIFDVKKTAYRDRKRFLPSWACSNVPIWLLDLSCWQIWHNSAIWCTSWFFSIHNSVLYRPVLPYLHVWYIKINTRSS